MSIGERLKKIRNNSGLVQKDFATAIGSKQGTYTKYENEELKLPFNIIENLYSVYNIDLNWLMTGNGNMLQNENESANNMRLANAEDSEFIHVPLLQDVAAAAGGGFIVYDESADSSLAFRKDWLNGRNITINMLSAIHVTGDSMEPTLRSGDILLVDKSQTEPKTDHIYVVATDDGLVVKRSGGVRESQLTLLSDNPAVRDRCIDLSLGQNRIIGRVVWFGRAM